MAARQGAAGMAARPGGAVVDLRGFGWRHAGRRRFAVRGIDLRIERGERVLLLGPSGSGKSTLLAALAGLLAVDSGEAAGQSTVDGRAGIVFQDPSTQLVMARCGDDVAFGLENLAVPARHIWPRVDAALRAVGFPYPRERPTHALSGGEQQRLALAGVLALRPALLLLDEPAANLEPAGADLVRAALAQALPRDTTMILVEHRVEAALPLIDRVVVLAGDGTLAGDGPPAAVFAAHGASLAAQGVWVPGLALPSRRRPAGVDVGGVELLCGRGLGFRYPGRAGTPALSNVDITVRAGEALAVLGPNGAGKSTLALILGGLVAPGAGTLRATPALAGTDAGTPPYRWRAGTLARYLGSVFQNPEHQFLTNRVDTELALGPRRAGRPEAAVKSTVDELLARLRLDHLAGANPYTLSGGQARRLSVATALATAPAVLVLDEPTFGQDRRTWCELLDLLAGVRDGGGAVVTVTHDTDLVTALADRRLDLSPGAESSGVESSGAEPW